jgi:phospholipid/cholesterol/gamma-HCH transport system ATP-binding protein
MAEAPLIEVRALTLRRGPAVVQSGLDFTVRRGQVFAIMGATGAGKTALLRHMVGLERPAEGEVLYSGESLWGGTEEDRERLQTGFGVLFAGGALFSTKTLLENVALKLRLHTKLAEEDTLAVARLKLALMGLTGYEHHYPSEVNESRRVWAGLARATALDPQILFFEEPSARLDPLGARRVDDVIRRLRDDLGTTVVLVSNDLAGLFAVADEAIYLDLESKTMTARGNPVHLRDHSPDPKVRAFLGGGRA